MKAYSVTQVLSPFFDASKIMPDVLEKACIRGGEVHSISAAIAKGIFPGTIKSEYAGYIASFRNWFEINVAEVLLVEERVFDSINFFNGQPDFVFRLNFGGTVLTDIKTPLAVQKSWALQTAAYRHLVKIDRGLEIDDTMSLRLRANGAPALGKRYGGNYREDLKYFFAALDLFRYFNE